MGYTHYWYQKRPFTAQEWATITAEAKRICAKAQRALYAGAEDFASSTGMEHTEMGFRVGFKEEYAWRTFSHPERPTAMQGGAIKLAGPGGQRETQPEFNDDYIGLNGEAPEDYESFILERAPQRKEWQRDNPEGIFNLLQDKVSSVRPCCCVDTSCGPHGCA